MVLLDYPRSSSRHGSPLSRTSARKTWWRCLGTIGYPKCEFSWLTIMFPMEKLPFSSTQRGSSMAYPILGQTHDLLYLRQEALPAEHTMAAGRAACHIHHSESASNKCLSCIQKCQSSGWWYTYPSEKYESQLGWLFPIYGKMKNVPNHQSVILSPKFCRSFPGLSCPTKLQCKTKAFNKGLHPIPRDCDLKGFSLGKSQWKVLLQKITDDFLRPFPVKWTSTQHCGLGDVFARFRNLRFEGMLIAIAKTWAAKTPRSVCKSPSSKGIDFSTVTLWFFNSSPWQLTIYK